MTLSTNGKYLILTGYDGALGTASIASSSTPGVPRVVGRIDANGNVDTTTALVDADLGGNNIRSAASTDGINIWIGSAVSGANFTTLGSTSALQLSTTTTNLRQAEVYGSQLYVSTGSGSAFRIGTVGTGLPTTAGQTISSPMGLPTSGGSPYAFFYTTLGAGPGFDTLYVADDSGSAPGGVTKYSLSGGTWSAKGTVGTASDSYRGLTGVVNGTTVTLYSTRKGGNGAAGGGEFVTLVDASGAGGTFTGSEPTALATAAANTSFRGIAFAPQP